MYIPYIHSHKVPFLVVLFNLGEKRRQKKTNQICKFFAYSFPLPFKFYSLFNSIFSVVFAFFIILNLPNKSAPLRFKQLCWAVNLSVCLSVYHHSVCQNVNYNRKYLILPGRFTLLLLLAVML